MALYTIIRCWLKKYFQGMVFTLMIQGYIYRVEWDAILKFKALWHILRTSLTQEHAYRTLKYCNIL